MMQRKNCASRALLPDRIFQRLILNAGRFVRFCNVGNCWQNWLNYCTAASDLCYSPQGQLSTLKQWKDPNKFRARQRFELALLHSYQWDRRTIAYIRSNKKWKVRRSEKMFQNKDVLKWRKQQVTSLPLACICSCCSKQLYLVSNQLCTSRSHLKTAFWWSWKHTDSH